MQLGERSLDEAVFGGRSLGKDRVVRQWSWSSWWSGPGETAELDVIVRKGSLRYFKLDCAHETIEMNMED